MSSNLRRPLHQVKIKQWESFRHIVDFVWRRVPLYRSHFKESGFHPSALRSFEDIRLIPKTNRELFQSAAPVDYIAGSYNSSQLIKGRTSGFSGKPLSVYYTKEDWIYRVLLNFRVLFFNGMRPRDKVMHISDARHASDFEYFFQKLGFLSKSFLYIGDDVDFQLRKLAEVRPSVIYSYPSNMLLLAEAIKRNPANGIKPRLIFTTAELLTPADREKIEGAFCAPVRDIYGAVEMGDMAWQCPCQNGYHINIDSFLFEIEKENVLPESESGRLGKLVITNLHSLAMPFIRYELNDVVTAPIEQPCPCGCTFPRIKVLNGRLDDWLYAADGRKISPLLFVIGDIPGVSQYRIWQDSFDHLTVKIVAGNGFSEHTLRQVKEYIAGVMGPGQKVEVVRTEHIPAEGGKMRRIISNIPAAKRLIKPNEL
ncbi:MAG: hypothetical protein WC417_02560 [Candidatus Omnitrophota bacterium]